MFLSWSSSQNRYNILFIIGGLGNGNSLIKKEKSKCLLQLNVSVFFLLLQAPSNEKLPVMYLMDSIVKNVGREYLSAFAKNLVATFVNVFEKVYMISYMF